MVGTCTGQCLVTGGLGLSAEQDLPAGKFNEFLSDLLLQVSPSTRQVEKDLGVICCQVHGRGRCGGWWYGAGHG